jgi:integrase
MMSEQETKKPRLKKDGTPWGKKTKHVPKQLTETGVERMKSPKAGKQIVIFDTGQKGLVLKAGYAGGKSFSVIHYPEGKPRYFWLGNFNPKGVGEKDYPDPSTGVELPRDLTLAGARRAALLFRTKPSAFLNPQKSATTWTFRLVAEKYLAEEAAEYITKPEIERCLKKYTFPVIGDRPMMQIKRSEIVALRSDIAAEIRASKRKSIIPITGERQADAVFGNIRTVMLWWEADGEEEGFACPIKAKRKKRRTKGGQRVAGKRRKGRTRILNDAEIKLVWEAAGKLGAYGTMVKLLLLTGQRREKMVTARRTDFDGDVWTIAVEDEFEKGNGGMLRLPPFAMAILKDVPKVAGCSYIFAGRYGDKPFNSFSQGAEDIRELLPKDMPRWTLHDLRRTARSIMTDLRIDDRIAEQVLGHAIEGSEENYNMSEYLEQKSEALATLAGYIQNLVDPTSGNVVAIASRQASTSGKHAAAPQ